jgi:hypothetical protein
MIRVLVCALVLVSLACTSKNPPPAGGGDEKADSKAEPKPPEPKYCTEIGCQDSAIIDVELTAAGAPLGKHEFTIEIDGVAQACSLEFADAKQIVHATCSGDASLWLGPDTKVVEMPADDSGAVSARIEPIPGVFKWQLTASGTPKKIHVVHSHAGKVLLDQTAEFTEYAEFRPNGPDCDPICKSASVQWKGL